MTQAGVITTTDYLSGFQYMKKTASEPVVLQFFPHAEGYVNATQNGTSYTFNYVYNYTDHLGNIRLSYSLDPSTNVLKIIEENHYYPFGLKHTSYNSDKMMYVKEASVLKIKPMPPLFNTSYNYKFGGNEFQDELGLNVYDYDNRVYDQAIGRFWQMDPLAEQGRRWSPYNYCFDNPIYFRDPDGMWPWPTWKDVKNFASGFGNGAKNFVPNAINHFKSEAKGLANAYNNITTNPKETVKYALNHSGPAILYNMAKSQVETPVSILKNVSKGDYKKAGEAYANHVATGATMMATDGAVKVKGKTTPTISKTSTAETPVSNPVPSNLARVIPADVEATTLGAQSADRVFVTTASDISGLNASGIANKLTIPESPTGFQVIEFPTPNSGIATPINSNLPGFIGGGKTAGGATEFTIPNQPIPTNATKKIVE